MELSYRDPATDSPRSRLLAGPITEGWRGVHSAAVFERLAGQYDAWYEGPTGRVVFPVELGCLAPLLASTGRLRLEVGVGSGRFAAALGVGIGLDPAAAPLRLACSRGVTAVQGVGERLPFADGTFGAVLLVVTLCFADDPGAVVAEARRVLRGDGALVLGMVFADSPWGRWYRAKAARGHPFYAAVRFLTRGQVARMLDGAGFELVAVRSSLLQPPSERPYPEPVRDRDDPRAGFVAWRATIRP